MQNQTRRISISNTSNKDRNENPTYMPMKPPKLENNFAVFKGLQIENHFS